MTYLIHTYDPEREDGWYVSKESENLNDFNRYEQSLFNMIRKGKTEYVEDGNTMFTIYLEKN
jgi:hypothetical protein